VLDLGLTEDSLHHNVKNLITDLEALGLLWVETFFLEQLAVTNEHLTKLTNLTIEVVRRDLIELQTHFLDVILHCF